MGGRQARRGGRADLRQRRGVIQQLAAQFLHRLLRGGPQLGVGVRGGQLPERGCAEQAIDGRELAEQGAAVGHGWAGGQVGGGCQATVVWRE
jgi:hypothetical protein